MKKTAAAFILLIMTISAVFAQQKINIAGTLKDKDNNSPIAFATVALYSRTDSSLVTGVVSADNGRFDLTAQLPADCYVKIDYVGYQSTIIDKIAVITDTQEYDLGVIELTQSATALEEVVVAEERLKGTEEIDRTVFNLNDNIRKISNSGIDVLKHIPSVQVDFQDNVTLEGKSDIHFYVDGVQRDKDFVSQINPENIDKVEIMTNPSVKYGADISGVINIVLKKEARYGFSGSVVVDVPSPDAILFNPRANLEYGMGNVRLYVSDRMHLEDFDAEQISKTTITSGSDIELQDKRGRGNMGWHNNYLVYGMDWFINTNNTLNIIATDRRWGSKQEGFLFDNRYYTNNILTNRTEIDQRINEGGRSNYYSFFYKHNFATAGREITVESGFFDSSEDNKYNYTDKYFDLSDQLLQQADRGEQVKNNRNHVPLKIDYTQIIGNAKLEAGYNGLYEWYDNQQTFLSDLAPQTFVYDETRHSGYLNLNGKYRKLMYQAGLRAEYSDINIDEQTSTDYFCLLPQASLSAQNAKNQSTKLSYRRRIYRPGISDLNPFEKWYDEQHVWRGNADLTPSYSNDLELSFAANFKSNFIQPKLFASYITDQFNQVSYLTEQGVATTTVDNIGQTWRYGASVNGAIQITKWWRQNMYVSLYNQVIGSDNSVAALQTNNQQMTTLDMNFTSIFMPGKGWNLFLMTMYSTPSISYQRTQYRDLLMIGGVEKALSKSTKLSLMFLPPYTNEFTFQRNVTKTDNMEDEWAGVIHADYLFVFEFTYTFSTGRQIKKVDRSTEIEGDGGGGLF